MTAADNADRSHYDPRAVQEKWQQRWPALDLFRASDDPADPRPRTYVLDMFPYPSGDLHMGHAEAYAIADAMARYYVQRGHNVLHPIGWDSFGLPAENAAIRTNSHPADYTYRNIETQAASFRQYALSFDWSRRLHTSDPEYYRWTQWLFLRFYERGLAYRKDGYVNWCPVDQTVLANEQVVAGKCERCGAEVIRRTLTQWYFKITEYADRLLADMEPLEGQWPDRILLMQRNWIGRSQGAEVSFVIEGRDEPVTVFTTRPDTLYGATFFVVAADSPLAQELCAPEHQGELDRYLDDVRKLTDIERQSAEREKTGVFLGRYAINPVNGERIPVWAADYVLPDYGTGAIMAVPAHDQRDLDFARTFGLPVQIVVDTGLPDPAETGVATPGEGQLVNSGPAGRAGQGRGDRADHRDPGRARHWAGARSTTGCATGWSPASGSGARRSRSSTATAAARSRCPTISCRCCCPTCAARTWRPRACRRWPARATGSPRSAPSAADPPGGTPTPWTHLLIRPGITCVTARRGFESGPFEVDSVRRWAPIDLYVGGVEHAILHLLYSRFFTKVLYDMKMVDFVEPFTAMMNQGQVINHGKSMSKSLGNGVDLGQQLAAHGVDAIRLTMIFASPPEDDIDWADMRPEASVKFLGRVMRVAGDVAAAGAPAADAAAGNAGAAQGHPPDHRRGHPADPGDPAERGRRAPDGAGRRGPPGHRQRPGRGRPGRPRGGRDAGHPAVAVRALHGRGVLGDAGPRAVGGHGRLAAGRPVAAGGGHRHLRGPGGRQGPGPAGDPGRDRRGRAARAGAGHRRSQPRAGRPRGRHGHRPAAQAGQHRLGLSAAVPAERARPRPLCRVRPGTRPSCWPWCPR